MPKGEREPKPLSESEEALNALDDSIFNLKSVEDTMNWDRISQELRGQELTIDDFRAKISQALNAVYWIDKGFPANMMKRLDDKIKAIKAQQEKK